jgi:hypothetical protein
MKSNLGCTKQGFLKIVEARALTLRPITACTRTIKKKNGDKTQCATLHFTLKTYSKYKVHLRLTRIKVLLPAFPNNHVYILLNVGLYITSYITVV